MDIYTYVATTNPYQAKSIIHKYGYSAKDVGNTKDLGACLKMLVGYEGDEALNDVLDSHPDKNVIIERYQAQQENEKNFSGGCGCGCNKCKNADVNYSNFMGLENMSKSNREVSIFILASALLLGAAIIAKK